MTMGNWAGARPGPGAGQFQTVWIVVVCTVAAVFAPPADAAPKRIVHAVARAAAKSVAKPAVKPAPLPPVAPFPADATAKTELVIGGLRASLNPNELGAILTVGGTAFVTVTITDPGGNKTASLLAEMETGKVVSITGKGVQTTNASGGLSAEIGLPASGATSVIVEFAVKDGETIHGATLRSRLRLTLLPSKGGSDETMLSWKLADCAGDYKHELAKIVDDRRARMVGTLDAVSAAEANWPTAWVFAPAKPAALPTVCKPQKGKAASICKTAPAVKASAGDALASLDEARVLELANAILHQKGALPQYQQRTQPLRQASYTLLSGLRAYMEQDAHPALCSGVVDMLHYYETRTGLLRNTIDETKAALVRARTLANEHIAALASAGVTAASATGPGDPSPADLVDQVAKAVLAPADLADVVASKDIWAKLRQLKGLLDGSATSSLANERRATATAALGMIEAVQYLTSAVPKYARLDETIYGTMSAIETAHKKACVCGT